MHAETTKLFSDAFPLPREMREPPAFNAAPSAAPKRRTALFINPFYPKDRFASFGKHVLTPTLALTSVAAATPAGWQVRYWDENLLQGPPPIEPFPELVGITVHLTFAKRAYALAAYYRERGATVILGGLHATSCPEEVLPHADAIVVGDGVSAWPQLVRDFERGNLRRRYAGSYATAYADDPAPRRRMLPRQDFLTTTSLIATRGCHNRCGFCYLATDGLFMPYRMRQVEQVVGEFKAERTPYAVFTDSNLGSRPEYLRALCRALRPLEKIWSAAVTIDVTDDVRLVREMALSGCTAVFIGFESLNGDNLDDAKKKTPSPADYARRVRILHDHGIAVNGSFVLGFDHDRRDVFAKTAEWVEHNRLECATFHILTPYPKTPLFRQMQAEGRLLHQDWERYDTAHAVFQPKHMSAEQLEAGYTWLYRRLFSAASIWRRRPERATDVPAYLAMSVLYKRANAIWPYLIKHRRTAQVWRPMVEAARLRHVRYRRRLAQEAVPQLPSAPVYAGV